MLSIRGWKTVFVPFSLMRLFFAPKEKPVPCPTVKCPHPPHPVERTFHVSFCPLFVAGTGRKVSLESPNFQLFTLYRKFGGLTWDLTMVLSMYVWKTSGRNCVSSTGKQECQRKQFKRCTTLMFKLSTPNSGTIDIQKTSPLMMQTRRTPIVTTAMKKLF